jgi:pimeloyl-ACP methyl ester carboxylesterase
MWRATSPAWRPERVRALVLIATSTRPDTPALQKRKGAIGNAAPSIAFSGLSRTAVATSLHPKDRDNEALIERVRAMGTRLGGEVFRRQSMLERPGDLERLSEIRCPTLVVAAAQDQLRSLEEARELQAGIPGATLAVIEDTGHMIPIEAPQRLAEVIVPWLARIRLARTACTRSRWRSARPPSMFSRALAEEGQHVVQRGLLVFRMPSQ